MRTITAKFGDGYVTRRTEAEYTYVSRKTRHSLVHWHKTEEAARRAAGAYGEVVATDYAGTAPVESAEVWAAIDAEGKEIARYEIAAEEFDKFGPMVAWRKAREDGHAAVRVTKVRSDVR